jgi:hypothetical protein
VLALSAKSKEWSAEGGGMNALLAGAIAGWLSSEGYHCSVNVVLCAPRAAFDTLLASLNAAARRWPLTSNAWRGGCA